MAYLKESCMLKGKLNSINTAITRSRESSENKKPSVDNLCVLLQRFHSKRIRVGIKETACQSAQTQQIFLSTC